VDFQVHHYGPPLRLQTQCRVCRARYVAALAADPRRAARRRAYHRRWQAARRRAEGRRTWEQYLAAGQPILGRKHCSRCGRWRPVSDFGHHKGAMGYTCMACLRQAARVHDAQVKADPIRLAQRREYQRIWHEVQRRRAGVAPRPLRRAPPPDPPWRIGTTPRRVPTRPLRPHVLAWLRAYAVEHPHAINNGNSGRNGDHRGLQQLAKISAVPERRIYGILTGEYQRTHYAVADRLAIAMDLSLVLVYGEEER
jgi:hypothetical protein